MVFDNDEERLIAAAKLRQQAEILLQEQSPAMYTSLSLAESQRQLHELQVHRIELELQNAELRQAREEVEASLERYTDLYDFAPVSYFTLDRVGAIQSANLTAAALMGIERSLLIGRSFGLFVVAESRHIFSGFLEEIFLSTGKGDCEVMLTAGTNTQLYVRIEAIAFSNGGECRMAVIDISGRRRAEEAQRDIEELNRMTLQALPAHIAVIDRQWGIIAVNEAWANFAGDNGANGDLAVVVGSNYCDVCHRVTAAEHAADAEQALAGIEAVLSGAQEQFTMEYPCNSPQQQRWFSMTVVPLGRGGVGGAVIAHTDISARKEAEEALRKEEERLHLALEAARMGTWDWHVPSGAVVWNEMHFRMFGYEIGEVQPSYQAWTSRVHPDDIADVEKTIRQCVAKGGVYRNEFRSLWPGGTVRWLEARGEFEYDENGQPLRCYGVLLDSTDRKQFEEYLQNAHEELEEHVAERTRELSATVRELVQTQESLRELNQLYLTLSETGKAIARFPDRDELFREICRIAVEHGGFLMAWIGLLDDESGLVYPVASFGACTDYLANVRISARFEPEGMGPTGSAIRTGSHFVCNDFFADPNTAPWHAEAAKRGFLATAALAISRGDVIIGAITFYAGEQNYFDQQKIDLLLQMQADINFALENLERESQRRAMEKALLLETAERLRSVEQLREKEQMLLQQSRQAAMGEMINNIAHQWRQPLNSLGLIIQKLPVFYDSPEFNREFLENNTDKAMNLIKHMSQTIESFRNFFRHDKKIVVFDLREVLEKTLLLIKQTFEEQKITIEVNTEGYPKVFGYPNEYAQVLLNILMNARDQLFCNNVDQATISIHMFTAEKTSVVTIADNGGGIAKEVMDRLFEPYFTTKGPDMGTGVGLFMSKTIVENNMGGRLSVRNTGKGAEFRIEVKDGER